MLCLSGFELYSRWVPLFDLFTLFRTDLIQSEASWKLSSNSDWAVNVCTKECELIKVRHTFGLLAVSTKNYSSWT